MTNNVACYNVLGSKLHSTHTIQGTWGAKMKPECIFGGQEQICSGRALVSTLSSGSHMMLTSTLMHRLVELLSSTSTHLCNSPGYFCRFQTMLPFLQILLLVSVLVLLCTDTQCVSSLTQPSLPNNSVISAFRFIAKGFHHEYNFRCQVF